MPFKIRDGLLKKYNEDRELTDVVIPDGVTHIEEDAFSNCEYLRSVTIPDSVVSIGNFAFIGCRLFTSITIPDSVEFLGDYVFSNCDNLVKISIPEHLSNNREIRRLSHYVKIEVRYVFVNQVKLLIDEQNIGRIAELTKEPDLLTLENIDEILDYANSKARYTGNSIFFKIQVLLTNHKVHLFELAEYHM